MRARPCLTLLALGLVAAGCGAKEEPTEALRPTYPLTVEDATGRDVQVLREPETVVALSPSGARLVGLMGGKARTLPSGAGAGAVQDTDADLSILPASARARADELQTDTGAPTFVIPEVELPLLESSLVDLGLAIGHPLDARRLAEDLRRRRERVETAVGKTRPARVFIDVGGRIPAPQGSLLTSLVRQAGGKPVGKGTRPLSPQEILKLDPEVYITTDVNGLTLPSLKVHPVLKQLKAVRRNRILTVRERDVQPDDRAYELLERLADTLHPGVR